MFSDTVVEARIRDLHDQFAPVLPPGGLQRYPHDFCWGMQEHLAALWDPKKKTLLRELTREESAFITNERLMVRVDYRYWAERYCKILKESQDLEPLFPLWKSQDLFLRRVAKLELDRWEQDHPDGLLFNVLKARQLGMCLDPSTRVLTADLQWVALDRLPVGTFIVATDEHPGPAGRTLQTGVVEAKRELLADTYELTLSTGQRIIATAEHRWLTRNRGGVDTRWRPVGKMIVGDVIRRVAAPWGHTTVEDAWVGGLVDGEGSLRQKTRAGVECNISQVQNGVWKKLTEYLDRECYTWREEIDRRTGTASKLGQQPVHKAVIGRVDELFRFIGQTRPVRFINRLWWEGKALPGRKVGDGWVRVEAIRPMGRRRVIDLQTSTKTFIAEGLVSHNSTFLQSVVAHRGTTAGFIRCLVAGDVEEQSRYIFSLGEGMIEQLPWWLLPEVKFHQRQEYWESATGAVIRAAWGKSSRGGLSDRKKAKGNIGRGKTNAIVHLTELSTWERPEQIDDGLLPSIPRTPKTFVGFESTAKGRYDWWHKQWLTAQKGNGRFTNIFIPWYIEPEKYWMPVREGWEPLPTTKAHMQAVEDTSPRYLLGETYRLTREQAYWYEQTRLTFDAQDTGGVAFGADGHRLPTFYEEYPANEEEAFQHAGKSIFGTKLIESIRMAAKKPHSFYFIEPASEIAQLKQFEREQATRLEKEWNDELAKRKAQGIGTL